MTDIQNILRSEHERIDQAIFSLEESLENYNDDDERGDGLREILAIQREHKRTLDQLSEISDNPEKVRTTVRAALVMAEGQHDATTPPHQTKREHDEDWWDSLNKIRYLQHLVQVLDENDPQPEDVDHSDQPSMAPTSDHTPTPR